MVWKIHGRLDSIGSDCLGSFCWLKWVWAGGPWTGRRLMDQVYFTLHLACKHSYPNRHCSTVSYNICQIEICNWLLIHTRSAAVLWCKMQEMQGCSQSQRYTGLVHHAEPSTITDPWDEVWSSEQVLHEWLWCSVNRCIWTVLWPCTHHNSVYPELKRYKACDQIPHSLHSWKQKCCETRWNSDHSVSWLLYISGGGFVTPPQAYLYTCVSGVLFAQRCVAS